MNVGCTKYIHFDVCCATDIQYRVVTYVNVAYKNLYGRVAFTCMMEKQVKNSKCNIGPKLGVEKRMCILEPHLILLCR
jgi:hypothetical protein